MALAGVILGLVIGIGFVLLVVPGLLAMTWLFAVIPVVVLERLDFAPAFGRSIELVRGNAWQVFLLILLLFLILLAVSVVVGLVLGAFGLPFWLNVLLRSIIANTLIVPFLACALTLGYFALKEGESSPPAAA